MTIVRSGVLLTVAVGLANVLNAVFQFSLARILDPDEYALVAALFAVVIVGAIPPLAFQATAAREVSARLSGATSTVPGSSCTAWDARSTSGAASLGVAAIAAAAIAALADMDDPLVGGSDCPHCRRRPCDSRSSGEGCRARGGSRSSPVRTCCSPGLASPQGSRSRWPAAASAQ